jgi:hypothetical protein
MKKGKSRTRPARRDFLKSDAAANARHRAREQARAKVYDHTRYDGNQESEVA